MKNEEKKKKKEKEVNGGESNAGSVQRGYGTIMERGEKRRKSRKRERETQAL